jgi:peptidoglycan biosynthesis protein MviN/MurJ (putative lipid II flippase)
MWLLIASPNLLRDLFAEGALSSAFVPYLHPKHSKKKEKSEAFHFANLTLTGLFFLTGFFSSPCQPFYLNACAGDGRKLSRRSCKI